MKFISIFVFASPRIPSQAMPSRSLLPFIYIMVVRLNGINSYATNQMILVLELPHALDYAIACHESGLQLDSQTLNILLTKCFQEYKIECIKLIKNTLIQEFHINPTGGGGSLISSEKHWKNLIQNAFYGSLANSSWIDLDNAIRSVFHIRDTESLNVWDYIAFIESFANEQNPHIYNHIMEILIKHKQFDLALFIWDYFRFCQSKRHLCNN